MTDWLSIWQNEAKPSFHEGLTQADHLFVRGLTAITHQAHKIR